MQEMGILEADAPTSGVTPAPIHLWFTASELGHPLIDDNHDRPLHPMVGPFLCEYLSRHEDMDDEDDEMRHLYTGFCDTRVLAHAMLEDCETEPAVYDIDKGETTTKRHLRRNRKRFSTLHTARDPNKNEEVELESEDVQGMTLSASMMREESLCFEFQVMYLSGHAVGRMPPQPQGPDVADFRSLTVPTLI